MGATKDWVQCRSEPEEFQEAQLYTIRPDGTDQRQITNLPGDAFLPHWPPQSNRIVFEFDPANIVNNDFCNIATMSQRWRPADPAACERPVEAAPTFQR
jgi:Tol biopolymer transport system component